MHAAAGKEPQAFIAGWYYTVHGTPETHQGTVPRSIRSNCLIFKLAFMRTKRVATPHLGLLLLMLVSRLQLNAGTRSSNGTACVKPSHCASSIVWLSTHALALRNSSTGQGLSTIVRKDIRGQDLDCGHGAKCRICTDLPSIQVSPC